ncbi:MAG TPA: DUF2807 domain-containing protein [Arenibacter sp.]|nr:DUF2807 domain-containing protein [Arenibacter sp.]
MKRIILLVLLAVNVVAYAQRKPKIKGNRNVVEVREDLQPFNAIQLEDNLEVYLQEGPTEGYVLEADDNLLEILKFRVADETLTISSFYNIRSKKKLRITVLYNRLNRIHIAAGTVLTTEKIRTDGLEVTISGMGRAELGVDAEMLDVKLEGNANGDFNMEGDSLNIEGRDKSSLKIYAVAETTTVQMAKNSSAFLEGYSKDLTIKMREQASLKAAKMEANTVTATVEGNTSTEIFAVDTLELNASGASKTYAYGSGKINLTEFLDTSELYKRKK